MRTKFKKDSSQAMRKREKTQIINTENVWRKCYQFRGY